MTSFGDPGRLSSALMMLAFGAAILFSVVRVAQTANHEYFFAKPYVQAETSVQPSQPRPPFRGRQPTARCKLARKVHHRRARVAPRPTSSS